MLINAQGQLCGRCSYYPYASTQEMKVIIDDVCTFLKQLISPTTLLTELAMPSYSQSFAAMGTVFFLSLQKQVTHLSLPKKRKKNLLCSNVTKTVL